jgi:hypothetical protein
MVKLTAGLASGLRGHYRDDGVPRNQVLRRVFWERIIRYWGRILRRCSQRHRLSWQRMDELAKRGPAPHQSLHPYLAQRLCVITRGRSPVR